VGQADGVNETGIRTAAALSEHPLATHAVGECVGQLLDIGGPSPDLVVLFVTAPQVGALEDISPAVAGLLGPGVLIGASAVSVLAGSREAEEHAALAAFGLWTDSHRSVRSVRLTAAPTPDGPEFRGIDVLAGETGTLILVNDPFSFPVEAVLEELAVMAPDLTVIGGMASAARQRGGNRLLLDGELHTDGAVGVLLDPSVPVRPVVSQGCRPFGEPQTVTRAERNIVYELAGRPALDRLLEQVERLDDADRALAAKGLHIGRVIDEHRDVFGRGDFLVRGVVGADKAVGAIAIGDSVDIGTTVQFQVRDAESADEDLRSMMADRSASGALVFTCNGRGSALFGTPDHDAAVIHEALGDAAVAGMFCAGEIGPIGGANFVHGFTASVALIG
jgi:small ligand-binding sensory domain FIST